MGEVKIVLIIIVVTLLDIIFCLESYIVFTIFNVRSLSQPDQYFCSLLCAFPLLQTVQEKEC